MTDQCTCSVDSTTRYLDRKCPQHGDAEEQRRHQPIITTVTAIKQADPGLVAINTLLDDVVALGAVLDLLYDSLLTNSEGPKALGQTTVLEMAQEMLTGIQAGLSTESDRRIAEGRRHG